MFARTHVALAALMIAVAGCSASAETVNPSERNTNTGSDTPAPPAETLSVQGDDTVRGAEPTPLNDSIGATSDPSKVGGPVCNIVAPQAGSSISARITHEAPSPLIREAIPNKFFVMFRAELHTERGVRELVLSPSTVVIRDDSLFQEALFDGDKTRTAGTLEDSPEGITTVRLSCASTTELAQAAPDTVFYSKVERELVLERVTPDGVLRRFYR